MFFFYNEGTKEPFTGNSIPYHKQPATKIWLKHFENAQYLLFIINNPRTIPEEKRQAHRELSIADRKMEHWKRHPNFDQNLVLNECERIKKQWKG